MPHRTLHHGFLELFFIATPNIQLQSASAIMKCFIWMCICAKCVCSRWLWCGRMAMLLRFFLFSTGENVPKRMVHIIRRKQMPNDTRTAKISAQQQLTLNGSWRNSRGHGSDFFLWICDSLIGSNIASTARTPAPFSQLVCCWGHRTSFHYSIRFPIMFVHRMPEENQKVITKSSENPSAP